MNYEESDIIFIYELARPNNWDDIINYLTGRNQNLSLGKEDYMINDFKILCERKVLFEPNPKTAYKLINKELYEQ